MNNYQREKRIDFLSQKLRNEAEEEELRDLEKMPEE